MTDITVRLQEWLSNLGSCGEKRAERAESGSDTDSANTARPAHTIESDAPTYSPHELVLLSGRPAGLRATVEVIKATFADLGGATVVAVDRVSTPTKEDDQPTRDSNETVVSVYPTPPSNCPAPPPPSPPPADERPADDADTDMFGQKPHPKTRPLSSTPDEAPPAEQEVEL